MRRDSAHQARRLACATVANDEQAVTAHEIAAQASSTALPQRIGRLISLRAAAIARRRAAHNAWVGERQTFDDHMEQVRKQGLGRGLDHGIEM